MLFATGAAAAAVLAAGAWRYRSPEPAPVHLLAVVDTSASHTDRCDGVVGLVERVLPEMQRAGGTISLLAFGSDSTANEPRRFLAVDVPRMAKRVMEAKSAASVARARILTEVRSRCAEQPIMQSSPIFLAVTRAVEAARGLRGDIRIAVQTDLQENAEPAMKRAVRRRPGSAPWALPTIDNSALPILLCGYAATTGKHWSASNGVPEWLTPPRTKDAFDRLLAVWKSVFTAPDLVSFEPFCPAPSASPSA
jgi:hypothetical protein